jgi:hypothetical protein
MLADPGYLTRRATICAEGFVWAAPTNNKNTNAALHVTGVAKLNGEDLSLFLLTMKFEGSISGGQRTRASATSLEVIDA